MLHDSLTVQETIANPKLPPRNSLCVSKLLMGGLGSKPRTGHKGRQNCFMYASHAECMRENHLMLRSGLGV